MVEFKSQVGQDEWVCGKLSYKKDGYFLDIGAHNGIWHSNTYYLEKELGWNGVCVEATTSTFESLITNRVCKCVNTAIYSVDGVVEFASTGDYTGIRKCLQKGVKNDTSTFVQATTMRRLIEENNVPDFIDYVSIDVEGADYDALLGFPFDTHKVGLWTIEDNAYLDGGILKSKIKEIMIKNGYMMVLEKEQKTHVNLFETWWIGSNN